MKRIIRKILITLLLLCSAVVIVFFFAFQFKPVGDLVFSVCFGSMYSKAGDVILHINGQEKVLPVYKAQNKPFLILGPYLFDKDYHDFFFVSPQRVIRTATDKGGDTWIRICGLLFMLDDMTNRNDCLRAPYWDDLKCDPNSSVRLDDTAHVCTYSFKIDSNSKPLAVPVSFSIPSKFFTSDMPSADNFVFND